jgi:predicted RNase H-like nuclease
LLHRDVATLKGRALKQYEDKLDALFCAYLAWYCWKWGAKKNEMYGSMEDGYIVVATR